MVYCDRNEDITYWASEELSIPLAKDINILNIIIK